MPRIRRALAIAASTSLLAAWGCNAILGIEDKDRPVAQSDAGTSDVADASAPTDPRCFADRDCPALDPCLGSRCDLDSHRCVYTTCEPTACTRGTCSPTTRACTTTTNPYGTASQSLALPGVAVGCDGDATRCFAASYPFAFVGTQSGVVAISIADLTTIEPPRIPVDLPFAPSQIVASGNVVYFVGPIADGKLAIASLVVSSDPRKARLAPDAAQLAYPFPTVKVLPGPEGDALLVDDDATLGYPSARVDRTFNTRSPIVHVPAPAAADAGPSPEPEAGTGMYGAAGVDLDGGDVVGASSGDRIFIGHGGNTPRMMLLNHAGTAHALAEPPGFRTNRQPQFLGPGTFAMGPNGTVVWAASWFQPTADPSQFNVYNMAWWLATSEVDPAQALYDEYYAPDYKAFPSDAGGVDLPAVPSVPLPIDTSTLFFVEPSKPTNPSGFSVFAVRRVANSYAALFPGKQSVLQDPDVDTTQGKIAAAQTLGYGLLLLPTAQGMRIVMLDPRCPPLP